MFLSVLSLLVGFLCLFVVVLMLFHLKLNRKTNIYLLIILFVAGLQRFVNAMEVLEFTTITYSPLKIRLSIAFYIVPVYYLFFRRLILVNTKLKDELLHFILPTLLVLTDVFFVNYHLSYYLYLVFSTSYFGFILLLVNRFMKLKKRSVFEDGSYKTIKTWAILMSIITFSLVVFSNYFLFNDAKSEVNLNNFYRLTSVLWFGALIYMFKNPIIIFGRNNLLKSIQKTEPQEFLIWSFKPLKVIDEKDRILSKNISSKIDNIIFNIQNLQKLESITSTITLTSDTLSKELKIPRSHVEFLFKYYCYYSINDFSNLLKVNYAVSLIKEGYLEKYTVASLGEKCLFNSRFTFSKNFKKFIGVSVSYFVRTYANRNDNIQPQSD
jgi:AraC-like DNA-binding protein